MEASSYEQLIIKDLSGTLTPAEQEAFATWLEERPEHKRLYEEYRQVWKLAEKETARLNFQTEQEWQRQEGSLEQDKVEEPEPVQKVVPQEVRWWNPLRIAAAMAIFLISAAAVFLLIPQQEDLITRESGGKEMYFTLPDGTEIWLNRGSSLSYSQDFGDEERLVRLQGEAFFAVAHNPEKPFTVQAEQARVQVLGTSFNVKAYTEALTAEVVVVTGKVSLAAAQAEEAAVVLQPGEKGILLKATNVVSRQLSQNPNALAWKDNRLQFQKTTLQEVIPALEGYFGTRIQVQNQEVLNCRFTSTFDDPQLEEVLEALRHSLNIRIVPDGEGWSLEGEGCKTTDA